MSESTSIFKSNVYAILGPLVDSVTFIGSGLLANSYLTTWMNPPMSVAGIAFAALLNAGTICGGKKIAKTDESNSLLYKTMITLGGIGLATLTLPYIAAPLANRLGIITEKAAFQLGALNISAKAGTHLLYLLGSYFFSSKEPLSCTQIQNMKAPELTKYHTHFLTKQGQQDWFTLSKDIQLTFLAHFEKEKLPPQRYIINWEQLTDEDLKTYHTTIWNVLDLFIDCQNKVIINWNNSYFFKPMDTITQLQSRCFNLNLAPPQKMSPQFNLLFSLSFKSDEIQNYTKNQALWAYDRIFVRQPTLGKKTLESYIDLFYKYDLFLPLPTIAEIKAFHLSPLKLYHAYYTKDISQWERLPLEVQFELSNLFETTDEIEDSFYLLPVSIQSIKEASEQIIIKLHEEVQEPAGIWKNLSIDFKNALNERFTVHGLLKIDQNL